MLKLLVYTFSLLCLTICSAQYNKKSCSKGLKRPPKPKWSEWRTDTLSSSEISVEISTIREKKDEHKIYFEEIISLNNLETGEWYQKTKYKYVRAMGPIEKEIVWEKSRPKFLPKSNK